MVGFCKKMFKILTGNSRNIYAKVVIFQLGHLGDMVHLVPLIRNLKQNNPGSHITLITNQGNTEIAGLIPWIDQIITFNDILFSRTNNSFLQFVKALFNLLKKINACKFDLGIDLRGHINALYILYLSNIKQKIGFNYAGHGIFLDKYLPMNQSSYEKDRLLMLLNILNYQKFDSDLIFPVKNLETKKVGLLKIGIFPGAPFAARRYLSPKFAYLADQIIAKKWGEVVLLGGVGDLDIVNEVVVNMKNHPIVCICDNITNLIEQILGCSCFISNDTGPMHLAVALRVPTIALFGPGNYKRWWKPQFPHIALRANVECSPCKLEGDRCSFPKTNCMSRIKVDDILWAVKKIV